MAENTMLSDAIAAIRQGEFAKAKELLTRLIKADQHDPIYWVWMSAAVQTRKERIYALKTALRLDPDNAAAKRGLVLFGAIPPDEETEPFPLNRARLWEEELLEKEEELSEGKKETKKPILRLAGIAVALLALVGFALFGLSRQQKTERVATVTPGPSPTYTTTPTALNAKPVNTQAFLGPTPLWALLDATYTPTPLYVNTPRSVQASDYGNAVKAAYRDEDWEALLAAMEQIATLEPESADPYYYMGEAYRFMGKYSKAFNAYAQAIKMNNDFGAAYLGRARVHREINANADIRPDLNAAIKKDPYFAEAYLERAAYWIEKKEYENALDDLEKAEQLSPNSPLVYFNLAKVYWAQDKLPEALEAAEKSLELDRTHLDTYFLLGELYQANDQLKKAAEPLEIYTAYEEENAEAFAILGGAYYAAKKYDKAIETLDHAIRLRSYSGTAYLYRGLAYLALGEGENAVDDLDEANRYLSDSFDASIALAQAEEMVGHYGNCYLQVERTRPLVETEYQEALTHYWSAICHEGRNDPDAALKSWEALLEVPESAQIRAMQAEAKKHLSQLYTPTPPPDND